jgi:hypothetical protein
VRSLASSNLSLEYCRYRDTSRLSRIMTSGIFGMLSRRLLVYFDGTVRSAAAEECVNDADEMEPRSPPLLLWRGALRLRARLNAFKEIIRLLYTCSYYSWQAVYGAWLTRA